MDYCIKLRSSVGKLSIEEFKSEQERAEWLRINGYYESSGIHRHLNGSSAGLFRRDPEQVKLITNCDKPISSTKGVVYPWATK